MNLNSDKKHYISHLLSEGTTEPQDPQDEQALPSLNVNQLHCSKRTQKNYNIKSYIQDTYSSPEAELSCCFLKLHFILAVLNPAKFLQCL